MIRITILLLSLIFSISSFSQNQKLKKDLDSITSLERAEDYITKHKSNKNKIITFNEEKHKTRFSDELFNLRKGGTKTIDNELEDIHYKVIEKNEITYYRVHYILLDGSKMSILEIDKLRTKIVYQIKNGVPFKDLADRYSMDNNRTRGGDSGWFTSGDMLPEFEAEVMSNMHSLDDIFLVNVESNKWYYVVKKSFDKKQITEIKVLKIVRPKH